MYAVDSHAIMMKEKFGKMTPHFGQESLMVYTTHKCTLPDHVSQLTKVKNEKPDCVSSHANFFQLIPSTIVLKFCLRFCAFYSIITPLR